MQLGGGGGGRAACAGFSSLYPYPISHLNHSSQETNFLKPTHPYIRLWFQTRKHNPNSKPNGQYTRSFSFLFRFLLSPQLKFCLPNRKYWINLLKYIYILICYTIVFTSSSLCFWISLPFTYILHKSCLHSIQLGLQLKDRVPHSTCLRDQNRTLWRRTNLDIRDAPGKISHVSLTFKGTEGILV